MQSELGDIRDDQRPETPRRPPVFNRTDWIVLAAVVGVALVIRFIYLLQLRDCPYFAHEKMDAAYHDAWARAIALGRPFEPGPYFRAPLYPWFLGMLFRLFGPNYFLIRLVQMAIGSVSCGLAYLIGRRVFRRPVAAIGALACSTYWILVYFDGELLISHLAVFLNLLLLWSLLRVGERRTVWRSTASGVFLGLSAIARPNVLLFAPPAAIWMLLLRPRWRAGLWPTVAFTVATLMPILPVTVRNYVVGKDLVLVASQGGLNLYIGNHAGATGIRVHVPGIRKTSIRAIYRETVVLAQREAHRPLKPSEVSRHYARKAVAFMRSEPAAAAKLMVYKLAYFWTNREILNNKHIYFLTDRYTPIVRWLPLSFWIVGPLGLMGLAACRGRGWELFPLWGFVVVYMFSVVLFFVVSRFRVPVLPVLMLLGAYGVASLVAAFRGRQWLRASVLVLVAGGGALLAAQTPPSNIDRPEVVLVGLARAELESGNPLGSLALLEEAISYNPTYIKAHLSLGLVQQRLGDTDEALATYERAVALAPRSVPARTGLARLLTEQGDYAEAIDQLRALADRTRRMNVDALAALASAYAEAGQFDRAVETAQEALRLARRQRRARKVDALKRQLADYRASRLPASPVTEPEIDAESKTDQYR